MNHEYAGYLYGSLLLDHVVSGVLDRCQQSLHSVLFEIKLILIIRRVLWLFKINIMQHEGCFVFVFFSSSHPVLGQTVLSRLTGF